MSRAVAGDASALPKSRTLRAPNSRKIRTPVAISDSSTAIVRLYQMTKAQLRSPPLLFLIPILRRHPSALLRPDHRPAWCSQSSEITAHHALHQLHLSKHSHT